MKYYKINRKELIEFLNSKAKEHLKCKESDKIEIKLDGNDYNAGAITVLIDEKS
jgi:hypothetical protein